MRTSSQTRPRPLTPLRRAALAAGAAVSLLLSGLAVPANAAVVHPGAFCAPEGATGVTVAGTAMICAPASDGRDRWIRDTGNTGTVVTPPPSKPKPKPVVANHLVLPSKTLTPGRFFASASVDVICKSGYSSTVRNVPESLRKQVFARYHIDYALRSKYELDHLISLELGGNNGIGNLWPEPFAGKYGAHAKDAVEGKLHSMVCSGRSLLHDAQHAEAVNWYTAVKVLLAKPKPVPPVPVAPPVTGDPAGPSFGDGTHLVGSDIQDGLYTAPGSGLCYWERESDLSGQLSGIIANGLSAGVQLVAVAATDVAFKTQGCGTWRLYKAPPAPAAAFGEGDYVVNQSIVAGTYRAAGGSSCYWQRERDFSGALSGVIVNDFGTSTPAVTIDPSDAGFRSERCGAWTLLP